MSLDRLFLWKIHWTTFGLGSEVRWGWISGNHQGRVNNVSQVDKDSDIVPVCACWQGGGRAQQSKMASRLDIDLRNSWTFERF